MQKIHQGLVHLNPETYFLNSKTYKMARRYWGESSAGSEIFCIDNLFYEQLYKLYQKDFSSTYCFLMEEVLNLEFLQYLQIKIPDNMKNKLLNSISINNKSYSSIAFNLTKYRENLLKKVGLRSVSSLDHQKITQINNLISNSRKKTHSNCISLSNKKTRPNIFRLAQKISDKLFSLIKNYLSWRSLMQKFINRFLPYEQKKFDYGFIELSKVDKKNSIFLSKKISDRVHFNKNFY